MLPNTWHRALLLVSAQEILMESTNEVKGLKPLLWGKDVGTYFWWQIQYPRHRPRLAFLNRCSHSYVG